SPARALALRPAAGVLLPPQLEDVGVAQPLEHVPGEALALLDDLVALRVDELGLRRLAVEQVLDPLVALVLEDADLVAEVLLHHEQLGVLDLLRAVVLLHSLAREDLDVDHDALDARGAHEARVAHVARLLPEDRAEELLLGGELGLALGRDL